MLLQTRFPAGLSFSFFQSTVPWTPSCTLWQPASLESRWSSCSVAGREDTPWRKTAKASLPPPSSWRRRGRSATSRLPTSSSCRWSKRTLAMPERTLFWNCTIFYKLRVIGQFYCHIFKLLHDNSTVFNTPRRKKMLQSLCWFIMLWHFFLMSCVFCRAQRQHLQLTVINVLLKASLAWAWGAKAYTTNVASWRSFCVV